MRGNVYLGVMSLCLGLLPVSDALACSWDLNGVGYPASCGYRGRGGGGGGGYVAPAPYVPPPPSPAQIAAQQARPINQAGINAENAGNLPLAVSLFEQAVRLSPGDAVLVNNLRHARAQVIDNQGIEAARAGNWALALALYQQAFQLMPTEPHYSSGRATLRNNIQQARNQLEQQQGRERQLQQDRIAATNVQQTVQGLAQSLSAAPASAGAAPSGGLPFMASNPATPAQPGSAASSGSTVQLNPGARLEAAAPEVKGAEAIKATSAKGQLFNSGKETTGQLFDNGRAHDDATVDARFPNIATPAAQSPDARFTKNKDYQAAATELARTQIAAETLNKKMATLLEQQKTSPTPERQTEIYNLSGQLHEAGGAVAIATNNVETVKKKIIQEGPAIVVDDDKAGAGQSAPAPAKQ